MIWTMIEITAILAESLIAADFLITYFKYRSEKYKFIKTIILFVLLSLNDFAGSFLLNSEAVMMLGFCSIGICFSLIFLKGNFPEKIVISIISYVLFYFVNIPVLTITSLLTNISADMITDVSFQSPIRIIGIFITKLLYFIFTQIILIIRKKEKFNFKSNEWIIVTSAFSVTLIIGFLMYTLVNDNKFRPYIYVLIAFLLSALDIIIFVFVKKMNTSAKNDMERQLLKIQLMQQENDIQQLELQYQENSIIRHDYKNKIDCIYTLLSENNNEKALKYVENICCNDFKPVNTHIQSLSSVINAVVNAKFSIANKKNIDTSCRVVVKIPDCFEYDFSIILSNLLDNAIEACEKNSVPSQIIVTISETAGYYRIIVKNTIEKSVLKINNKLQSSKSNKMLHGFGLKSVYGIAEKHNGSVDIYEKDSLFIVSVMLIKNENINMGD